MIKVISIYYQYTNCRNYEWNECEFRLKVLELENKEQLQEY